MAQSVTDTEAAALALVEALPSGSPLGLALLDADARVVTMSPALAALTGTPAHPYAQGRLRDILPAEIGAALEAEHREVVATGRPVRGCRTDAGGRTWETELHALDVGGTVLVGLVTVDVTARAHAEQRLRESERQLAAAQRIAGMGWWIWDSARRDLTVSAELAAALGMTPHEIEAVVRRDFAAEDPPADDPIGDELRAAIRERRPFHFRHRVDAPDGTVRVVEAQGVAQADADGRLATIHGFAQDITAVERAAARRRALAELGRAGLAGGAIRELLDRACALVAEALWVESATVREHGRETGGDGGTAPVLRATIDTPRRRFGELCVQADTRRAFDPEDAAFLSGVGHVLGEAIGRRETAEDIAALAAARGRLVGQALEAEARARRSISEHLHDGPLQDLLAAGNELYGIGSGPEATAAQEDLRAIASDLRAAMLALHPTVLHYGGLAPALSAVARQQARTAGLTPEIDVDDDVVGAHDELILSIARHLLADVARLATATRIAVTLRRDDGGVRLEVADDGSGPEPARVGVGTSAERVAAVGGRLDVHPEPGGGTRVVVDLPLV